jgi:hypothetical protein
MLRAIAVVAMQGRWQAAAAIALFSVAALMLPPLSYIASGVIALSTLRMGPKEGIKVVAAATVILTLISGLLLNKLMISGLFLISSWLPMLGITLVLGYTRSLALSLLAASGLAIVCVFGAYLVLSNPTEWWQQLMTPFFDAISQQQGWQMDQSQTQALILEMSSMMTGLIAAGVSINVMLGLLLGRAWQAKLYNPGGFATEFHQLRLGKPVAMLTVAVTVIATSPLGDSLVVIRECLPVMLAVFALQGISVAHAIVKQQQKRPFWLVVMYLLLVVMMPQMVVLLAVIGVLEQWLNFRKHSIE